MGYYSAIGSNMDGPTFFSLSKFPQYMFLIPRTFISLKTLSTCSRFLGSCKSYAWGLLKELYIISKVQIVLLNNISFLMFMPVHKCMFIYAMGLAKNK